MARSDYLKLTHFNGEFVSYKQAADRPEWCELLWCFYQLFGLSFWRHPFTAKDPLVSRIYLFIVFVNYSFN